MPKVLNVLDLNGNALNNAKVQPVGTDPSLSSGDEARFWYNNSTHLAKIWNGSSADTLSNLVETTSGSGHITSTLTGKNIAVSSDGTNANTAGTLVARDGSGNFTAGTITAALAGNAATATTLAATANVTVNSFRLINVADPTSPQDAATKNYVDAVATGLDIKGSVKAATIAALSANTYANGTSGVGATLTATGNGALSVDGYTVAANDRILVKNETSQSHNGIYTVTATGGAGAPYVLTRATDADTSTEVTSGMFTFVESTSSTLGGSGWALSGTGLFTIGSTALVFGQFTGGAPYTQGNGINIVGNAISAVGTTSRIAVSGAGIDIDAAYAGQTSITTLGTIATGTWSGTAIALNKGGTGATTAAAARTALGTPGKFVVGSAASTTTGPTAHGLGNADLAVSVVEVATGNIVYADVTVDATNVTVAFGSSVSANAYRIVVVG